MYLSLQLGNQDRSPKYLEDAGTRWRFHTVGKAKRNSVDRRDFLKSAAVGAATLMASPAAPAVEPTEARRPGPPPMSPEAEVGAPTRVDVLTADRTGSDFMVDVIKSLGIEYVCANPGSSFRALHESVINYGGNRNPESYPACHEESAVAMAHGYAKIEGKPLGVLAHGTVGLQHASMAIYNAFCDRAPVYLIVGNIIDATKRLPGVEWAHSVQDAAEMVRDYVKWDDLPASLPHFAESAVRAYKIAMTPPMMPVLLVADGDLQERAIAEDAKIHIPKLALAAPPEGDEGSVTEAARLLVAAENPVIVADRAARTPAGMKHLIELAETLQAPVIDQGGRMNFPTRHPLNQTDRGRTLIADADVILGLELTDFWGATHAFRDQLHRTSKMATKDGAKLISITAGDLYAKGNYQDLQRYPEVDLAIAADAETTLPSLTEAVKRLVTDDRKRTYQDRGGKLADARQRALERARTEATYGWDSSPITIARLSAELWAQIKNEDWSLFSDVQFASRWPMRLWSFDKHYQFIGGAGGAGEGYCAPASAGAALAKQKDGRLSVSING